MKHLEINQKTLIGLCPIIINFYKDNTKKLKKKI